MDIKFNDRVESQLRELKSYKNNSREWQMSYFDLYNLINHRIFSFCKSIATKIQNEQNLRIDVEEYCSAALTDVLIKLVEDFDPYKDKGFMNLYYYRIKKAFINIYKKELSKKCKSLTTSIEWKSFYNDRNYTYLDTEENEIYIIIEEYANINPKAKLIYAYEESSREEVTKEILKVLHKKKYGNSERQCVNRTKKGLQEYIIKKGITIYKK